MIALKKLYGDELLRLALVLSLLKVDPHDYLEQETQQLLSGLHISNGSDWSTEHEARTLIRPRFVHPKSLDNILINYERELFDELNSLGRYADFRVDNGRMRVNPILHTYLVNNVATDSVAPVLATQAVDEANQDGVSADDNVAQEIKVSDDDSPPESDQAEAAVDNSETSQPETPTPDAVVTLSADFFSNHTESDIFAEIATRSFDVNEFIVQPEMQIKKEPQDSEESDLINVQIKKEPQNEDLYSDNAMDDFVPYFTAKSEKFELGEPHSVFNQNMADLRDYEEFFDDVKELRNNLDCLDVKQHQEDLEQYLLENTPLDSEVYELAPMFEEELVLGVKRERASTSFTSASSSGVSEMDLSVKEDIKSEPDEGHHTGDELTPEDMNLIEVLWKQDVDMGFSLEDPTKPEAPQATKVVTDEIDRELRQHEEKIQSQQEKDIEEVKKSLLEPFVKEDDPWAGLSYTVDTETGEYVLQGELPRELVGESRFDLLEEALQLVELGDDDAKEEPEPAVEGSSSGSMLHPAMRPVPHHPLAHYHNQSLMRSMSVEQRWQDLASLLTIPPPPPPDQYQHYHHQHPHPHPHSHPHPHPHHNISAHGAAGYAPNYHPHAPIPPVPEKHPDAYAGAAAPLEGAYKVESAHHQQHDGIYYQDAEYMPMLSSQNSSEMAPPPAQDGFLQSILNDEDLQLMDMAMNEGMYTMRMLEGAGHPPHPSHPHNHTHMMLAAERDSASDSAVSSMGSERVPSLSDGEWCDGSDSAHEYHSSKFRPYDSPYIRERAASHAPQKKHHMFGKRCFQDQQQQPPMEPMVGPRPPGVVKNEWPEQAYRPDVHMHNAEFGARAQLGAPLVSGLQPALDLNTAHSSHALIHSGGLSPSNATRFTYAAPERVRHNHTYSGPAAANDDRPQPPRDKRVRRLTDGSVSDCGSSASAHLSRDEKRAKALGIPLEVHDIINLPMDEFNERLSKHDLSEAQLSLIRDIRRRGKNKVAAQNCRKRKLDQITSLADEVRNMRERKQRTARDHTSLLAERARLKERFAQLYRHVFQHLRDPEGRPLSSHQYSLQQAADGNVVLVPKMQHPDHLNRTSDDEMDRKTKNFDQ